MDGTVLTAQVAFETEPAPRRSTAATSNLLRIAYLFQILNFLLHFFDDIEISADL